MEGWGLKDILYRNKRLKVLSLFFATALWFFVAGQSNTEVGFIVPLGFKGIAKDMVMLSTPPEGVEVRVSGPSLIINDLSPSGITLELDLSEAKEGINTYRLSPKDVDTPLGVTVQRLRPASIELTMERLVEVELPVKVKLVGAPAKGYRSRGVSADPATINASVLKRDSKRLKAIYTKAVDVTGLVADVSVPVELDMGKHELRSMSSDKVVVRVVIEKID